MVGDITELYFNWMCELAIPDYSKRNSYSELLDALNELIFYYKIPLDENRLVDGVELRYIFARNQGLPDEILNKYLAPDSCSVLEMMVALALRTEESIMYDPDVGNQLPNWFMEMIFSLKLENMTNSNFYIEYVEERIDILLRNDYEPNGVGGLFTIDNPRRDLRQVEIWYQMCWYVDSILK